MCGDLSSAGQHCLDSVPLAVREELLSLRRHNAELLQLHKDQERSKRELQNELAQLREQDCAKRVARYAQEKASCVLRHEEQLQKLRQHYEQQLADAQKPNLPDLQKFRSSLQSEQQRADCAEAAREAGDVATAKLKKKLHKSQQQRAEQMQKVRRRFRHFMSTAVNNMAMDAVKVAFCSWRTVAAQSSSQRQSFYVEAEQWGVLSTLAHDNRLQSGLLSIVAARPHLTAHAALHAWATIVTTARNGAALEAQLDAASFRATAALHSLRSEVRGLRASRRQAGVAGCKKQALLALAAPFSSWARTAGNIRHEARLRGQRDESSVQSMSALAAARMDVRTLRARCHKVGVSGVHSRALIRLAAPFCAWARDALEANVQRKGRPGDVVLNSGEAAKRAQKQLEETRTQCREQLEACQQEVTDYCLVATTATRAKRRAHAVSDSLQLVLIKEHNAAVQHAVMSSWNAAIANSKRDRDLSQLADDVEMRVRDYAPRIPEHVTKPCKVDVRIFMERMGNRLDEERGDAVLRMVFKSWDASTFASRREQAFSTSYGNQVQEAREYRAEQLLAAQKQAAGAKSSASAALRSEKCAQALLERQAYMTDKESSMARLVVVVNAWRAAASTASHEKACSKSLAEASLRAERAVACVRNESSIALRTAWDSSIESVRQAAALERRNAAELDVPSQSSILRDLLCEGPRGDGRPSTARDVERQLELAEQQARCLASPPTPSTAARTGPDILTLPESQARLPAESSRELLSQQREHHHNVIAYNLLHFRERQCQDEFMTYISLLLQAWRRQLVEVLLLGARFEKQEEVVAAREGRKGLFIAALGQQARYWMAKAFAGWWQAVLEGRYERLRASASVAGPEGGHSQPTRSSLPSQSRPRTPSSSLAYRPPSSSTSTPRRPTSRDGAPKDLSGSSRLRRSTAEGR